MIKCKKLLLPLAILGVAALMAFSYLNQPKTDEAVFTTIQGEKISMTSLKGKVVLVNFWATSCTSCVKEMPALINTYNQYQSKGLEIIAIAMPYDPPAQVVNFATQKNLPFPVMHDGYGDIVQKFGGITVTPTALIYNKEGKRIQHAVGTLNFDKLHALLDKELS